MIDVKYTHSRNIHNLTSPKVIVPAVIKYLKPESVVDIGCGLGTFLKVFKDYGIKDVLGIDGEWTDRRLLEENINISDFQEADLEKRLKLNRKFDLAVSLEVAEHLGKAYSDIFVESLVNASNIILFSAAMPSQGGINHVNEQFLSYWVQKFAIHDYLMYDVFRGMFWNEINVQWWYKQNIVLFVKRGTKIGDPSDAPRVVDMIHPELFRLRSSERDQLKREMEKIKRGNEDLKTYLKLILYKCFGYNRVKSLLRKK